MRLQSLSLLCTLTFLLICSFEGHAQEQKKYALLIGINKYSSVDLIERELRFARADAESLGQVLKERNWETTILVDASADRKRIIQELYRLAVLAQPSDKVLIYFAGHGVRDPRGSGKTYWVTTEATPSSLISDGIRLNHILEYVDEIGAQEKILLLDHCYAGDFNVTASGGAGDSRNALGQGTVDINERDLFPSEVESLEDINNNQLTIFAAARGPAYEDEAFGGHGMFTKAVLDVLQSPLSDGNPKDGKISLGELWQNIKVSIQEMAELKDVPQRPISNATVNQLEWHLFDAKVNDFEEEAQALTTMLTEAEILAGSSLENQTRVGYMEAIADMRISVDQNVDPDPMTSALLGILRAVLSLGIDTTSLATLERKFNERSNQ